MTEHEAWLKIAQRIHAGKSRRGLCAAVWELPGVGLNRRAMLEHVPLFEPDFPEGVYGHYWPIRSTSLGDGCDDQRERVLAALFLAEMSR